MYNIISVTKKTFSIRKCFFKKTHFLCLVFNSKEREILRLLVTNKHVLSFPANKSKMGWGIHFSVKLLFSWLNFEKLRHLAIYKYPGIKLTFKSLVSRVSDARRSRSCSLIVWMSEGIIIPWMLAVSSQNKNYYQHIASLPLSPSSSNVFASHLKVNSQQSICIILSTTDQQNKTSDSITNEFLKKPLSTFRMELFSQTAFLYFSD